MIIQGSTLLRTPETYAKYHNKLVSPKDKECFICEREKSTHFQYWETFKNDFPYDAVASYHYLLVPKRHIGMRNELNKKELDELETIKDLYESNSTGFDCIIENFKTTRTFLPHYHLHLIKWKRI